MQEKGRAMALLHFAWIEQVTVLLSEPREFCMHAKRAAISDRF
jgi:hypothetical protein